MTAPLIVLVILALLIGLGAGIYNKLVKSSNECKQALAQIDVQLKRRYDLIPNLVESARAYLAHESSTLEEVVRARNQASQAREAAAAAPGPEALGRLTAADGALTSMLGRLMMVAENYPDLKADGTVSRLMADLSNTENLVGGARSSYNDAARRYNQTTQVFPNVLLSGIMGFKETRLWTLADPAEGAAVRISLAPPPSGKP
ncbi:MAG: LemA family protein [Deltaproteobacteria bacterium]|jgi:LemA protein|nr:LemA family protein [Deltaproteobacteria bacterium]